jgi:hypothetical protein
MSTISAFHPRAICRFTSTFSLPASVIELSYPKVTNNELRIPKLGAYIDMTETLDI